MPLPVQAMPCAACACHWAVAGTGHLVSRRSTTLRGALSRTDARLPAPRTTKRATLAHVDLGDACAWQGLF